MKSKVVNAAVDLLLDIVLWFMREEDDRSCAPAPTPIKQPQPGGNRG
jgi:hypothetical protein